MRCMVLSSMILVTLMGSASAQSFFDQVGHTFNEGVKTATGGNIDPEKGKYCAPPVCVEGGGVKVQKPEEAVGSVIGGIMPAYALLPESEREKINKMALQTGIIVAVVQDPVLGIVIRMVIGDKEQEVPVPTYNPNPAPTPVQYAITATCIFQRDETNITAAFVEDNADLQRVEVGDSVGLTAPICDMPKAITSALVIATSKQTPVQNVDKTKFKWALLGRLKQ